MSLILRPSYKDIVCAMFNSRDIVAACASSLYGAMHTPDTKSVVIGSYVSVVRCMIPSGIGIVKSTHPTESSHEISHRHRIRRHRSP